jgi:Pregnancy-associated plasma protein-A
MKKYIIIILLFGFFKSNGQGGECGTKTGDKPFIISKTEMDAFKSTLAINQPYSVSIFVTVFANDNGTNRAATDANILRQIQNMSNQYSSHNICFILLGIKQVNNTDLNNHMVTKDTATDERNEVIPFKISGVLNVFIHNQLPGLNGVAYDIPNSYLSMSSDAMSSISQISILAHEMGHCLGLYHTFENWPSNATNIPTLIENVARTGTCKNCTTNGDLLCDTPADFNYSNYNFSSCIYDGTTLDPCNVPYSPLMNNIMSYYNLCSNTFTSEQGDRMRFFLNSNSTLFNLIATDNVSLPSIPSANLIFNSGTNTYSARDFINLSSFPNNTYIVSGVATQKMVSRKITLKPGTRLQPTTGRVQITANPFCN